MKLEHLLLGVLAWKPRTGYDLKKFIDTDGRFLRSNTQMSQVYRSLAMMEKHGWVQHTVEQRPGATDAKRYRLTEAGAGVFLDWLTGPYQPPTRFEEPDLLARLTFAGFMSRDDLIRLLDVEIYTRENEIALFRFRDRHTERTPDLPFDASLSDYVAEWGHVSGSAAKDAYLARISALRDDLLAGAPYEPARPNVESTEVER